MAEAERPPKDNGLVEKYCQGCLHQTRDEDGAFCEICGVWLRSDGVDYVRLKRYDGEDEGASA